VEGNRLILAKAIERFLMEKAAHRAEKTCQEFTRGSEPAGPSQGRSPSLREYRLWTRREPVPHAGQTEQAQQACNCNWIALSFARRQISSTSEMFGTSVPCLRPAAEIIRAVSFLRLTAPGWKESSNVRMNLYSSQTDLTLTPIDARTLFSTNRDGIANADDPLETNH
jgi:hypothetical protein